MNTSKANMESNYSFSSQINHDELALLKMKWLESLTSPQDDMWESFRDSAEDWGIFHANKLIGYASIGEGNQLLQFYVLPKHIGNGKLILSEFITQHDIKTGIVGTNNPVFLSIALESVQHLAIHTYLFRDAYEVDIEEKEGELKKCEANDLDRIVDFCHINMGAPKEWLAGYIGNLIEKKEIFYLENKGEVIGTCEVRRSRTDLLIAHIGMVVSLSYRRNGYGTYLLHKAKRMAMNMGLIPICSCEKDNIGSIKSIHKCGFFSQYQLLKITFIH